MNIGIYGLGEAGSLISADLVAEGINVIAYDPADVPTPTGVKRVRSPEEVVCNAHLLLAITAGQDAIFTMQQAINAIPQQLVYADLSTNDVKTKKTLAQMAANKGDFSLTLQ